MQMHVYERFEEIVEGLVKLCEVGWVVCRIGAE